MTKAHQWTSEILIDHQLRQPLFLQVKEGLTAWIRNGLQVGSLSEGDRVPSQNELSTTLGVSEITVKRALNELQREGYIQRIQGRGSFIAKKHKLELKLEHLYSLTTVAESFGMVPDRRVLDLKEVKASHSVARHLEIEDGIPVAKLVRLRLVDDIPLAVDTSFLPLRLFPELLMDDHGQGALYDLMRTKYGIEPARVHEFLEPVLINDFESEALQVPVGSAAMLAERIAYSIDDAPIEFNRSVLRGDMCRFSVDMHKGSLSG